MSKKNILLKYKQLVSLGIIILILGIFIQTIIVFADEPGATLVYVNPTGQIVAPGENFSISINCTPGQPIKAFEFKLSFNATLLTANSVSEGNIFSGYNTFFNAGTINNSAGTIVNIYSLIEGQGNVTSPGSFVNISFTAKSISGISSLNIYDLGVTNETNYIQTIINNGTVQIDGVPPQFIDNSPAQGYTGDSYTFSVSVTDNTDDASNLSVFVDWSHGSNSGNNTMTHAGGNVFTRTVTLDLYSVSDLSYSFYAVDSYGNGNESITETATVIDNDAPILGVITANPSLQTIGGFVNITAQVTDNIGINNVFLNITYPDSSYENFSIKNNVSNNVYYCNKTYNQYGTHYYFVWVNDLNSNVVTSSSYSFLIGDFSAPVISNIVITTSVPLDTDPSFGWINITCTVVDNVEVDQVYLNITNPGGSFNNISMIQYSENNYYSNTSGTFSQHGNYTYLIWSVDNDLNSASSTTYAFSLPPNYDLDINGVQNVYDLVLISNVYGTSGGFGWIREDVDNNGFIQVLDMVQVSNHYGESWWL